MKSSGRSLTLAAIEKVARSCRCLAARARLRLLPPHPSHPIMRRPDADLEEKREPRVAVISRSAKGRQHEVIRQELDTGRDREGTFAGTLANGRDAPEDPMGVWLATVAL